LAKAELTLPDGSTVKFPIDNFAQHCLLNGIDQLGYILSFENKIKTYEAAHA
jgi:3-isopropylmalate/(R)-2-methylmalate dehydratase small subunit